jgi:hypothetical protein
MRNILLFVSLSLIIFSCETDFDTTAEWKDITVVYGLLDQRDSIQYIKINKAFLGEGDALMFAKEYDSVNYPFPLNVWIEEWDENDIKVQTIEFDTATSFKPDDPNAVFNTGEQRIYKGSPASYYQIKYIVQPPNDTIGFEKIWLNDKSTYKLFIQYPDSSKLVTSETYLVWDFRITKPLSGGTDIKFVTNPALPTKFAWDKPLNDDNKFRYELDIIFNYQEVTANDTLVKALTLTSNVVYPSSGSSELVFYYWDNNFFTTCTNNIPYSNASDEDKVLKRWTGDVDVKVSVAAGEFNLFMQVYEPSTSIVQEKPPYTNITNGIGIYSARYYTQISKNLHNETVADLKAIDNNVLKFEY